MKTILAIDDEQVILNCFQDALEMRGFEVLTTTDPEAGIRILRSSQKLDLLLLDVKMPGKSGFEVYQEVKLFRTVPVLFITAYPKSFTTDSDEVVSMWRNQFADGTTDILYKPFNLDTLFNKVEALIGPPDDEPGPT